MPVSVYKYETIAVNNNNRLAQTNTSLVITIKRPASTTIAATATTSTMPIVSSGAALLHLYTNVCVLFWKRKRQAARQVKCQIAVGTRRASFSLCLFCPLFGIYISRFISAWEAWSVWVSDKPVMECWFKGHWSCNKLKLNCVWIKLLAIVEHNVSWSHDIKFTLNCDLFLFNFLLVLIPAFQHGTTCIYSEEEGKFVYNKWS